MCEKAQRERATRFVFLFGTFGIATNLLQLYHAVFIGVFWPFFTGIVFQVVTALFQFARMILLSPSKADKRLEHSRNLFCRLSFVKPAIIHRELTAS